MMEAELGSTLWVNVAVGEGCGRARREPVISYQYGPRGIHYDVIRLVKPECHLNDGLRDSWRDDIDDRSYEAAVAPRAVR